MCKAGVRLRAVNTATAWSAIPSSAAASKSDTDGTVAYNCLLLEFRNKTAENCKIVAVSCRILAGHCCSSLRLDVQAANGWSSAAFVVCATGGSSSKFFE